MPYAPFDEERYRGEPAKPSARRPFARDRARVLHSAALRRLAAKTQVLVAGQSDIPRTRLTHTLEVAQIAREIAEALGADPDLVETAALAHDIGHPPFGHNGEEALHALGAACGGFEGNAQTFRVLTRLEAKVLDEDRWLGLNLTRAALDAATKYPWTAGDSRKFGVYADDLPVFDWMRTGAPGRRRCLEAQVMDWADDVAYSVHDVEDAILLGHVDLRVLQSAEGRAAVVATAGEQFARDTDPEALRAALRRLMDLPTWPSRYDGSHRDLAALKGLTSALIGRFTSAAQRATVAAYGPGPHTRYHADLVVPAEARAEVAVMKAVTARFVMQRPGAAARYEYEQGVIADVVHGLVLRGREGLDPWLRPAWDAAADDAARLRVVLDQVASLTDVSIVRWHERLVR